MGSDGFFIFMSKIYKLLQDILLLHRKHLGRELSSSNFSTYVAGGGRTT